MADEKQLRAQMNGLVTEPSRIIAGESGFVALDNALCKSPGLVEPRGGLQYVWNADTISSNDGRTTYVREWRNNKWFTATDGTDTRIRLTGNPSVMTLSGMNPNVRAEAFSDQLAWAFDKAIRMLDTPSGGSAPFERLPGAPRAPEFIVQGLVGFGPLADEYAYAYRAVVVRRVATQNGDRFVYSAPSERAVYWNTATAAPNAARCRLIFPISTLLAGDEIQVYRTPYQAGPYVAPPATQPDPGDELQLIYSFIVTTPSAGTYTWIDSNEDGSWAGPPLYTNDTQEGILLSNGRIRTANDIAYYNGMAFYGAGSRGQTKTISLKSLYYDGLGGANPDPGQTLASLPFTCTHVNGSPILTALNPTVAAANGGYVVGQWVNIAANDPETLGASPFMGQIITVNSGANTITIDANATAGGAGTAAIAWDWVGIETSGGTTYRIYQYSSSAAIPYSVGSGVAYSGNAAAASTDQRVAAGSSDMERAWAFKHNAVTAEFVFPRLSTACASPFPYGTDVVLSFHWEEDASTPGDSDFSVPFEVCSSKPFAFSQQVGLTYADNICRSEGDPSNRVWWSKLLQPEAVPLLQYNDIGDAEAPIVRMMATNDRLWIFKTDGLWSVYGDTPDTLTFQQVDPTLRLFSQAYAPSLDIANSTAPWVTKLGNRVFAWTNGGIFSISSAGVQRIDQAIEDDIRRWSPNYIGFYCGGLFSTSGIADDLVIFGAQSVSSLVPTMTTGICYAYHVGSGTWSTWSTQAYAGFFAAFSGSGETDAAGLIAGSPFGFTLYAPNTRANSAETGGSNVPTTYADIAAGPGAPTFSATVIDPDGVTITYSGSILPVIDGGLVYQAGEYYMVISGGGVGSGEFVVDRAGMTVASFSFYYPVVSTIKYAATTTGAPSVYKFFKRAYFGFQAMRGGLWFNVNYRVRGQNPTNSTNTTEYFPDPETITTLDNAIGLTYDREFESMRDIPTEQTQGTGLEVTLTIPQAGMYYALDSLTVTFEPTGEVIGGRS